MENKKVVYILTKTNWDEPPRIRHQMAQMMVKRGFEVYFFQKPSLTNIKFGLFKKDGLTLVNSFELIHHQLRICSFFQWINKISVKRYFKKAVNRLPPPDIILNFNYDYYFIKESFPKVPLITMINDNFISAAKPWMKKRVKSVQSLTASSSDTTLAVSKYLLSQVEESSKSALLFLPWATSKYQCHDKTKKKYKVLYWGYVNNRIQWDVVNYLLKNNIELVMVGKVDVSIGEKIEQLKKYSNFQYISPKSLEDLDLSNICCSLLSYAHNEERAKSITINNRSFNLLSHGIPLVYTDMPNLIQAPDSVIKRCITPQDYLEAILYFQSHWLESQEDIKEFLEGHYEEDRALQLINLIK